MSRLACSSAFVSSPMRWLMAVRVGVLAFGTGAMQYGRPHIMDTAFCMVSGFSVGTMSTFPSGLSTNFRVSLHSGRYFPTGSEKRNRPSS